MDIFWPLLLLCGWHLAILGLGVWIGHARPWRWRIVREGDSAPARSPYPDKEEAFSRIK
jgi:hypothetical protein